MSDRSDITIRGGSRHAGITRVLLEDRQRPPAEPWREWHIVGGCGFGKTYAHVEWIKANPPRMGVCVFTHRQDGDWFRDEFASAGIRCQLTSLSSYDRVTNMLAGVHPLHTVVLVDGAQSVHPLILSESLAYIRARGLRLLINSTEEING